MPGIATAPQSPVSSATHIPRAFTASPARLRIPVRLAQAHAVAALLLISTAPLVTASPRGASRVAARPWGSGRLELWRLATGRGALVRVDRRGGRHPVACDPLIGAWGLWVGDLDRDGAPDLLVALRKRARHDPVVANRPHLYRLAGDRCVPLWRGTRLAGRFVRLRVTRHTLWALERIGQGERRVARYRWRGFGFVLAQVAWRGRKIPARWRRFFGRVRAKHPFGRTVTNN